jgi:hypothetical protein
VSKRVTIVFEEGPMTPEGAEFKVYLEGINQETKAKLTLIPEDEWPPAVFWGIKCLAIVGDILLKTKAARSVTVKNPSGVD